MNKVKLKELGTFKNGLNFSASKVLKGCKMIGAMKIAASAAKKVRSIWA
jgi:hypothetical protein